MNEIEQDNWLSRLQVGSIDRDLAIAELRSYLVRGLNRSLTHRYGGKIQVDDLAQEALLRILDSLDSFESRSRFTTWAMAIAIRLGISELRRRYYRDVSLELSTADGKIQFDSIDPRAMSVESQAMKTNLVELLETLINEKLTDKQRGAIRGSLAGLPVEEIAFRLRSNRNAIYKLLHDARHRLRQEFEARGYEALDISTFII